MVRERSALWNKSSFSETVFLTATSGGVSFGPGNGRGCLRSLDMSGHARASAYQYLYFFTSKACQCFVLFFYTWLGDDGAALGCYAHLSAVFEEAPLDPRRHLLLVASALIH